MAALSPAGWSPDLVQAGRTALAAGLAWVVVLPLDGVADAYPYYAPLGAVVVVSASLVGTIRESLQRTLALLVGAGLAIAVSPWPGPAVGWLVVVVFTGSLVAARSWFSGLDEWVPLSAIYVLILGGSHPLEYAAAYVGLVTLGAAVGVFVNAVVPPLPLGAADRSVSRLRTVIADQLDQLADGLEQGEAPDDASWRERKVTLEPAVDQMRSTVVRLQEAQRANWLAGQARLRVAREQYDEACRIRELVVLVEDVRSLLCAYEAGNRMTVLGPRLRPDAAAALRAVSDVVRHRRADDERTGRAEQAIGRFLQEAPQASSDIAPRSLGLQLERILDLATGGGGAPGAERGPGD